MTKHTMTFVFGLSSYTTLDRCRQHRVIMSSLIESTFSLALDVYEEGHPLVASHDEARCLRMIEVIKHPEVDNSPILIGECWPAKAVRTIKEVAFNMCYL